MDERFREDNLANWNARAPIHAASRDYGLQRYVDDASFISSVVAYDAPLIGSIDGLRVAHLQCHIGTDSVSLARLGATVTGLDFSDEGLSVARDFSARAGTPVEFVQGDVYEAGNLLEGEFDLVYTTVGVLGWLDDIDRWARAVSSVLKPGGRVFVRDMHPFLWVYEEVEGEVVPTYPYRTPAAEPLSYDEHQTYTDGDAVLDASRCHSWNHPVSALLNALVSAGLAVTRLAEFDEIEWPAVPSCEPTGDGRYVLPPPLKGRVPAMLAVWAEKS